MATAASRLSSFWGSTRRRLALAGAVLALLVLAVAGVVLARGGEDETKARRDAVAAYIAQVNITQQSLAVELERVNRAYRDLRLSGRADPKQLARVERAERTLQGLYARLEALPAPVEARTLRRLLLRLVDLQAGLAEEVAGMARYIPFQASENRKLAAATRTLRAALGAATTGPEQRRAFAAYDAALRGAVKRLEASSAPAVLEPSRAREIERLGQLAGLSRKLGAALEAQRAAEVDRLFPRFVQVSASTGTTRAERDAVVAFNRRLAAITDQRQALVAERARIDLELR